MIDYKKLYIFLSYHLGFVLIIFSIVLFLIGGHNIDLTYNFLQASTWTDDIDFDNLSDETLGGEIIKLKDGYLLGTRQQFTAFFMLLFGGMLYGESMAYMTLKSKPL